MIIYEIYSVDSITIRFNITLKDKHYSKKKRNIKKSAISHKFS